MNRHEEEKKNNGAHRESIRPLESMVAASLRSADVNSVVAGISGGADSTALLVALARTGAAVHAVHCNFHLRGNESDRDQRFVEELCGRLGIDLTCIDFDTEQYCKENGVSLEMGCRDLRYSEFRKLMENLQFDRIAVAHNADDNVETVLLNLFRGTGIAGLRGMLPDSGEIIRPLLNISRTEILDYLKDINLDYITDSSNLQSDFKRNYIRNEILPAIEKRWPAAKRTISRTAENLRQDEKALDYLELMIIDDEDYLLYAELDNDYTRQWLVWRFARKYGADFAIVQEIVSVLESPDFISGKYWVVRDGRIYAERDRLQFIPKDLAEAGDSEPDQINVLKLDGKSIAAAIESCKKSGNMSLLTTLPPKRLRWRHTKQGDKIDPIGMQGSTTVSKILKDHKLSKLQKLAVWVAEDIETGKIIWIQGLKRSRHFLADNQSATAFVYTIGNR